MAKKGVNFTPGAARRIASAVRHVEGSPRTPTIAPRRRGQILAEAAADEYNSYFKLIDISQPPVYRVAIADGATWDANTQTSAAQPVRWESAHFFLNAWFSDPITDTTNYFYVQFTAPNGATAASAEIVVNDSPLADTPLARYVLIGVVNMQLGVGLQVHQLHQAGEAVVPPPKPFFGKLKAALEHDDTTGVSLDLYAINTGGEWIDTGYDIPYILPPTWLIEGQLDAGTMVVVGESYGKRCVIATAPSPLEYNSYFKIVDTSDTSLEVMVVDGATWNPTMQTSNDSIARVNRIAYDVSPWTSGSLYGEVFIYLHWTAEVGETPADVEILQGASLPDDTATDLYYLIGRAIRDGGELTISQEHTAGVAEFGDFVRGTSTNDMLYWDADEGEWTVLAAPSKSGVWALAVDAGTLKWYPTTTRCADEEPPT